MRVLFDFCCEEPRVPFLKNKLERFRLDPNSWMDLTMSSKVKMKGQGVGVCFLACNIWGIERHVRALGCELG